MNASIASGGPEDFSDVIEGLKQFIHSEIVRRHQDHESLLENAHAMFSEDGMYVPQVLELMREVRMAASEAGYYNMFVPTALGGEGLGASAFYSVWEAVFRECGTRYWLGTQAIAHWTRGPSGILAGLDAGPDDPRFPGLLSGERTMCFGMSEPDAGSDPWMMRTRAVPHGDGWRISGVKQWVSHSPYADLAVIFAVSDPDAARQRTGGITAFLVSTESPGFSVDSVIRLFGHAGSDEGIINLDEVYAGPEDIIGEPGEGMKVALQGVSTGRLYNAAKAVGLARWGLEQALDYAQERHTFGTALAERQGVTFPLAEAAMEIHAAHLLGLNCAGLLDDGKPALKEVAMTKAYSVEAALRALDRAIQVHGAMGLTNELGLAEAWQQMRIVCIADGSAEILRRQIANRLLKGDRAL